MPKNHTGYTQAAKKTLALAAAVSQMDNKQQVAHTSLFRGAYMFVAQTAYATLFWKVMGVKDVNKLDQLFLARYRDLDFSVKPGRMRLVSGLSHALHDTHASSLEDQVSFVRLLYAATHAPTQEAQQLYRRAGVERDTIARNCQYVMGHAGINKVGFFAFLEVLSKLVSKLALDINAIELMQIDFLQGVPRMSSDQEVAEKDPNSSDVGKDDKKQEEEKKLTVEYFGTDLTREAHDGDIDPIIGRAKEIDQVVYTLLRKTKNNPLLIGEAGVGKTAVVEGLARKIAAGDVPAKLQDKRLFMLDMGSIVAGTKYRGEFEARMKSILEEASDPMNNIILFIDEIHSIIGAGGQDNNDAAQMIKPLLARGKISLIGATTFDEYQKYIEKDKALKRRFQEIVVDEPDGETTLAILQGLKETYENYHGVLIADEALQGAIKLSQRYMLNRHLPDKAIDIIDEACARKSTLSQKLEQDDGYKAFVTKIEKIDAKIEAAIESQDYFAAASLKEEQEKLKHKMQQVREQKLLPKHLRQTIESADIGQVLADKTGIPADIVSESEVTKLKRLRDKLGAHVLGQDEAVDAVVKAITRNRLSVIDRAQPIASLLFLGPSGTGKTHLAKMVAKHYFGDEKSLIRVDMSEFMEKYSVSKLIGSAPGYVGHEEGGLLTEQVRRKPYSVVLLDEIEKADKDILNILLQVLDEGHVKDSKGRMVDFKSTVVIMTSNLGSDEFAKRRSSIGFRDAGSDVIDMVSDSDFVKKKGRVLERLKGYLSPELLNRLDKVLVFRPLSKEVLGSIFDLQIKEFLRQWKQKEGLSLPKFSKAKIRGIIDKVYDPQYGARPIKKYIDDEVEPQLIEQLMG